MRAIFLFLAILIAAGAGIAMVPLDTAIKLAMLDKAGLSQSGTDGNLWSGHIYGAQLGGLALGDIATSMSLADIVKGRVALDLAGADIAAPLKGRFSYGLGGAGVDGLSVALPRIAGAPPVPDLSLAIDGLSARFPGGACADASGKARSDVPGAIAALAVPGGFSGPALCRDGRLVFDMASISGRERQSLTILSLGRYRMMATVQSPPPAAAESLRSAGFVPAQDGYVYESERTL